jgi:hydroxypyruvate isomerase
LEVRVDISPCIEWLFADEAIDLPGRIRAAASAGYHRAEFHLWRDKPVDDIAAALADTGVTLTGICADPRRSLVDPEQHAEVLGAVRGSLVAAVALGRPPMIVASGFVREGVSAEAHFDAAVSVLKHASAMAADAGVVLLLEPLNDRIDHPGMYLVSTTLGLDIIDAVGSPNLRLLYDVYHSHVMGEDMRGVLARRIDRVAHVQVADMPGRNEPGTGTLDWGGIVATLGELGYAGAIGLEYRPTMPTAQSLAHARASLGL